MPVTGSSVRFSLSPFTARPFTFSYVHDPGLLLDADGFIDADPAFALGEPSSSSVATDTLEEDPGTQPTEVLRGGAVTTFFAQDVGFGRWQV